MTKHFKEYKRLNSGRDISYIEAVSLQYKQQLHITNTQFRCAINRVFYKDVATEKNSKNIFKAICRQLTFLKKYRWVYGLTIVGRKRLESHINLQRIAGATETDSQLVAKFIHVVEHETIHAAIYEIYGLSTERVVHSMTT